MIRRVSKEIAISVLALFLMSAAAFAADLSVTKTPWCGCCTGWIEHMREAGFDVTVYEEDDLTAIKARMGIEPKHQSCHTGEVEGYAIEGHVPAEDVARLLKERPEARGLTVPGMPVGSPGMEMGHRHDAYEVLLILKDGTTEVFAKH